MQIKVQSGLEVEIKPLNGAMVSKFLESKESEILSSLVKLLDSATEKIINSGEYTNLDSESFTWRQVYDGDGFDALLQMRAKTFRTPTFDIDYWCQHCNTKHSYEFNLLTENRASITEKLKQVIRDGVEEIRILIPEEDKEFFNFESITLRIPTLNTTIMQDTSNKMKTFSCDEAKILCNRIIHIEGMEDKALTNYLNHVDAFIQSYLIEFIDDNSWGVDFEIVTDCSNPRCKRETSFGLAFNKYFFQRPKRKKKK